MAGLESGQRADAREPGLSHYGGTIPGGGISGLRRLAKAASIVSATASVACTWATAAKTAAVPFPEVRYGIARLPDGRRKQILLAAADEIFSAFADQVLPVDTAAADHYAVIASSRERAGKPIAGFDALIAAVCRSHGATLATRNVSDFDGTGIEIIDPWLQSPG